MAVTSTPVSTLYPARRGTRPVNAEDLWTLPRVGSPVAFPDGQSLVVPVTRWNLEKNESRTQLYRVPAGAPGAAGSGTPVAITTPDASAAEPRVSTGSLSGSWRLNSSIKFKWKRSVSR